MTTIFRDGYWQSMAEKDHPQTVKANRVTALRAVLDDGTIRAGLRCLVTDKHDYEWAVRIEPVGRVFLADTWVELRIHRYPEEPGDNGTRWIGPFLLPKGETYWSMASGLMDHKGGVVGHGFGVDIVSTRTVKATQWITKLDPRHAVAP